MKHKWPIESKQTFPEGSTIVTFDHGLAKQVVIEIPASGGDCGDDFFEALETSMGPGKYYLRGGILDSLDAIMIRIQEVLNDHKGDHPFATTLRQAFDEAVDALTAENDHQRTGASIFRLGRAFGQFELIDIEELIRSKRNSDGGRDKNTPRAKFSKCFEQAIAELQKEGTEPTWGTVKRRCAKLLGIPNPRKGTPDCNAFNGNWKYWKGKLLQKAIVGGISVIDPKTD